MSDDDLAAVMDVYRSGWLTTGPRTEEFEARFAEFTGARHAIAVSSGTAALHLACLAAGFGPGDEVIVPSLTFVATVNAVAYTGATPVFADIAGLDQPWLSAESCETAVTVRTRGVLAVSYGGHSGETEAIARWCERRGLTLIEDAAHSAGSRIDGRHLGTFGLAGAFSMFSNKNLAVGEGGVLITSDAAISSKVKLLRSHGMTSLTWDRHRGHASEYDVVALGFNYRIDEPRAALALSRLGRLDDDNRRRAALDAGYRDALTSAGVTLPLAPVPGLRSSHHLFTIVLPTGTDRAGFRRQLATRGVQTSVHYPPAHHMSVYRGRSGPLPATEAYAARSVTLPMFAHMTAGQQRLVVETAAQALATTGLA